MPSPATRVSSSKSITSLGSSSLDPTSGRFPSALLGVVSGSRAGAGGGLAIADSGVRGGTETPAGLSKTFACGNKVRARARKRPAAAASPPAQLHHLRFAAEGTCTRARRARCSAFDHAGIGSCASSSSSFVAVSRISLKTRRASAERARSASISRQARASSSSSNAKAVKRGSSISIFVGFVGFVWFSWAHWALLRVGARITTKSLS